MASPSPQHLTNKMASANYVVLLLLSIVVAVNGRKQARFFDVTRYGAVADGRTDNSVAFLRTWGDACAYYGKSVVYIPGGVFMVGSVTFSGPCNGPIAFTIKGSLRAPTDPNTFFGNSWIGFRYVNHLTVAGGGYLDGQGSVAWPYNDCRRNQGCRPLRATLKFDFITNSKIHHIRSINSKNSHMNIFACANLTISKVRLTAPEDSPNTDGIRIGSSKGIKIRRSVISTGDDCVAMVSGSQNIDISKVTCGPGHGISIGSLGKSHEKEYVMGVRVTNCTFIGTQNGVRIKTWAPSSASLASNITFEDIFMKYASNPIVIDQQYCPHSRCTVGGSSDVQVESVVFKNIWGISETKVALNLQCSSGRPCRNVKLENINLSYMSKIGKATALCSNVHGTTHGQQSPGGCM